MSKLKNIIIFVVIGLVLTGGYFMFVKKPSEPVKLTSSNGNPDATNGVSLNEQDSMIAKELLGVLLNVKNIRLNDGIFNEEAFISLRDSTILLVPDGTEGRPNPFAPIGKDVSAGVLNSIPQNTILTPNSTVNGTTTTNPTTPVNPIAPVSSPTNPTNAGTTSGIPAN